jgi:hypothetical protein
MMKVADKLYVDQTAAKQDSSPPPPAISSPSLSFLLTSRSLATVLSAVACFCNIRVDCNHGGAPSCGGGEAA